MVRCRLGLSAMDTAAMDTAYTIVQALARTPGKGHTHLNLYAILYANSVGIPNKRT